MTSRYLAIDLGAESGRVMLGTLENGRLAIEELSRFSNTPIRDGDRMYWNIPSLLDGIRAGLAKAGALGQPITSVSTCAWGVDYVLLDDVGEIIEPVFHYRDPRTSDGEKAALARVDWPTLFAETGIQYMMLNTSIQLCAEPPARLAKAARLLTIADAINHLLCGVAKIEVSMASTTQLYNPRLANWSDTLIDALSLPRTLFPEVVDSGTALGPLKPGLATENGLAGLNVVASLSHDTASAVAAVPAGDQRWAYISSGTWSLMGLELPEPILTDACRELNFTNEIGHGGSIRLLKNIVGLWLVQINVLDLHFQVVARRDLVASQPADEAAPLRHEPVIVAAQAEALDQALQSQLGDVDHRADVTHLGDHRRVSLRFFPVELPLQMAQQLD